ncbi:hypothetical protein L1987_05289 [Smallanthus sonchifolius]|uniref:Uncharacterized protein n=1 Tax=Smallanthus sonchifolius TaxID=185202 RepID=A0ACB9JUX8_9ASTR|nr:hypothetical protein L1987_05289 [Smallanthus sonchifolius]
MENPNDTTTTASNSPEFEFWITRNPSSHQPTLHSADELFSDGVLLPLRLLHIDDLPDIQTEPTNPSESDNIAGSDLKRTFTACKRWKDIFKKTPESKNGEKKKRKNSGAGAGAGVGTGTAELNINLWPFSRSRSAGNIGSRSRTVAGNRKVSSAPCSRSNSTGDKYRKWPSRPGRAGVHLGRSSPVWQAKRFGQSRSLHDGLVRNGNTAEKVSRPAKNATTGAGAGVSGKVLNLNVPTCIGYRQRMSCQSDVTKENHRTGCVAGGDGDVTPVSAGGEGGASGLFNLKSLFTKKVF